MNGDVTVVLATYDRRAILARCLDALAAQTAAALLRVVVVDDGSADDTWEYLEARAAGGGPPELSILRQANQGQGAARNRGLRLVDDGLVVFLGDDVLVRPDFIAEHLIAHRGAAGPRAVVGFTDWCRAEMRVTPLLEMINREGHQFGYAHMVPGRPVPFTCFYTSNLSLPRELLGEEPFSPAFAGYGWEDVELGYRLSRQGLEILYHPAAAAEHLHPMDLRSVFARQRQVGRGIHTLLRLHPELAGSPYLSPREPPRWFPLGRRLIPPWIPAIAALDRRGLPLPRALLHRILLCGYYLGVSEGGSEPQP